MQTVENLSYSLTSRAPEHVALTFPRHYSWLSENAKRNLTIGEKLILSIDVLHRALAISEYLLNRGVRIVTLDYLPRRVLNELKLDLSPLEDLLMRLLIKLHDVSVRVYIFDNNSYLTTLQFYPERDNKRINIVVGYDHRAELRYMLLKALMSGDFSGLKLSAETLGDFMKLCRKYSLFERDPDLLIVFGSEITPDFLVYNISYSELVFIDKLLYEVSVIDLERALETYQRRVRRFGR